MNNREVTTSGAPSRTRKLRPDSTYSPNNRNTRIRGLSAGTAARDLNCQHFR
jgi:hypothetical protein